MRLAVVRRTKMPLVQWMAVIDAGGVYDPSDKVGLARLTADMLDEGTTVRDALAIARRLDLLGTRLSITAGHESTTVGMRTLRPSVDASFALLTEIVRSPRFAATDFDRAKGQLLAELAHLRQQPAYVADCAAEAAVFGPDHPYGRPSNGDLETVGAIEAADLAVFHDRYYRPERIALLAVGDVTLDEAARLVESHFGDWRSSAFVNEPAPVPYVLSSAPRLVRIERAGSAQTVIRIALSAVPRKSPAYFPLLVLNTVLGGQFSSRLNRQLREQKGCTYGARSELLLRRQAGTLILAADVDGGAAGPAVRECLAELAGITADRPVTEEELDAAKSYLCRRFPARFETVGQIVVQLAQLAVYELPDDFYQEYQSSVANVELRDIDAAVRRHLATDAVQVVVLGDPHDLGAVDDYATAMHGRTSERLPGTRSH
jgi:predicted Zn-dependent peptidase